jgi:hypothetical protein
MFGQRWAPRRATGTERHQNSSAFVGRWACATSASVPRLAGCASSVTGCSWQGGSRCPFPDPSVEPSAGELVQAIGALEDMFTQAVGPSRFLAHLYEPIAQEHRARPKVVCRSARKERPLSLKPEEDLHGPRCDAAPPPPWINPVGQLTLALDSEAGDHPGKRAVLFDRQVGVIAVRSHALVVSVERGSVRRIGTCERCHAGRRRIALPLEKIIQVPIVKSSEGDRHDWQPI